MVVFTDAMISSLATTASDFTRPLKVKSVLMNKVDTFAQSFSMRMNQIVNSRISRVLSTAKWSMLLIMIAFHSAYGQQWQWVETAGGPDGVNTSQIKDGGNDLEIAQNGDILLTGYYSGIGVFDTISILGSSTRNAFVARYDSAGNVLWVKGVSGGDVAGVSVKENSLGDIFLLGEFSDSAAFGTDTTLISSNNTWQSELFLAKYDASGNFLWALKSSVNTQSNHEPVELEINGQDEIYLGARISGPIQLDTILISSPSGNSLLAKFNANGDALWAKVIIDNYNEGMQDMSLDPYDNVYVAGYYQYNMVIDGSYYIGTPTSDPFIMKLDSAGNFIWLNVGTGSSNNWAYTIDASFDGSLYVAGKFDGVLEFDSLSLTGDGYYDDAFILKLDAAGNEEWLKLITGNGVLETYDILTDQFGNFYLSGLFWDSVYIESTLLSAGVPWVGQTYVASYQNSGTLNYAIQAGDTNGNRELFSRSLALSSCAGVYVAGRIKQTASFDNLNISTYGLDDAFFARVSNTVSRSITGNTMICPGDTTQLYAVGGSNYLWLPDSVYGSQFMAHPDSTTQYYVSGTACDGSNYLDSITITVMDQDFVAAPIQICNGDSVLVLGAYRDTSGVYSQTFTSSTGCDSVFTQEVIVSNIALVTLVDDTICANDFAVIFGDTVSTSGTYYDTISSVLGCDSVVSKALVVNQNYTTNLPADTICDGSFTVLFGDTVYMAGIYQDTLFSLNGCDSVLTKTLVVESIDTSVTSAGAQLSANQSNGLYQWIDCVSGLAIAGATGQTFQPVVNGNYAVAIQFQNCADTSTCVNVTNVGVEEVSSSISVYPNPAKNGVFIQNRGYPNLEVEFYSTIGQLVKSQSSLQEGSNYVKLNALPAGVYVCVLKSNGSIVQQTRLIKSK